MKKLFPFSVALSLLLCASLVFAQQPQRGHGTGRSEPPSAPIKSDQDDDCKLGQRPVGLSPEQYPTLPARGGSIDWGLALSGGGIRSGSYSVGVLKALYDLRLLDKIDAISSVSGGGLASYWLLTRYSFSNQPERFGQATLGDDVFLKSICELKNKSRFISKWDAFKMAGSSKKSAFERYRKEIVGAFGNPDLGEKPLSYLNPFIMRGELPYFIFNAKLVSGKTGQLEKSIDSKRVITAFELTPTHMGNPLIGFHKWTSNDMETPGLSESVTTSAAAVPFKWKHKIPNYGKEITAGKMLELVDGGLHSENLGALALVVRGVKNIIIVDASHDPKYKFSNYKELRDMLCKIGIDFRVDDIEKFLRAPKSERKKGYTAHAVSDGYAKSDQASSGTSIDSRILYIKLSLPDSIYPGAALKTEAKEEDKALFQKLDKAFVQELNAEQGQDISVCGNFAGSTFERSMYDYGFKKLMEALKNRLWVKKVFNKLIGSEFPQITTIDQKYEPELLEAFVELGYLQAMTLKDYNE